MEEREINIDIRLHKGYQNPNDHDLSGIMGVIKGKVQDGFKAGYIIDIFGNKRGYFRIS